MIFRKGDNIYITNNSGRKKTGKVACNGYFVSGVRHYLCSFGNIDIPLDEGKIHPMELKVLQGNGE